MIPTASRRFMRKSPFPSTASCTLILNLLQVVNPSTPRPLGRGLPSTRAQAERLEVDPEPSSFTPSSKTGLGAAERVNSKFHPADETLIRERRFPNESLKSSNDDMRFAGGYIKVLW